MEELWLRIFGIFAAVFLFGFAVLVHELGHFLAAKFFGIGVNKFAIGFGPKIWATIKGGTEYSIRWIPVGGFVALKGMVDEEEEEQAPAQGEPNSSASSNAPALPAETPIAPIASPEAGRKTQKKANLTEDLDALRNRHPLVRMVIFTAGVACNYLTAILLMGFLLWYGAPKMAPLEPVLEEIPVNTQLHALGWRSGDRIVALNGRPVKEWMDVEKALADAEKEKPKKSNGSQAISATVRRPDGEHSLTVSINVLEKEAVHFSPARPATIGMAVPNSAAIRTRLVQADYQPGNPPEKLVPFEDMPKRPLKTGDKIIEINGQPIKTWREMQKMLEANPEESITLAVQEDKKAGGRTLLLATMLENSPENKGRLGVYPGIELDPSGERERMPFWKAAISAPMETVRRTIRIIDITITSIRESTWQDTKRGLGGPIAIGIMAYKSARQGLLDYLHLFLAISIVLAVMNILPIPVLDGGYIAITFLEMIIRRPIPQRVLIPVLTTFFFLFIMLFVFIFYNDFHNWILPLLEK